MSRWLEDRDQLYAGDMFDPLCIERSAPMSDEEAAMIEALCQAATPGPLVVDDQLEGEGALVVSLPDGRLIVSLSAPVGQTEAEGVTYANAQLICKARYYLLRLLRDRHQWKEQREFLLQRIRTLETALQRERDGTDGRDPVYSRPR
ncbi:MAG: hypothetical protein JXB62_14575 [Pirellulales bacterium]|nr:hypothetical protein [Pirellulales bacterium]